MLSVFFFQGGAVVSAAPRRVLFAGPPEHRLRIRGPQHLGAVDRFALELGHVHIYSLDADRVIRAVARHAREPRLLTARRDVRGSQKRLQADVE